jgi:hypothetical protein
VRKLDVAGDGSGLYRLRVSGELLLRYVGEGRILSRVGAHLQKAMVEGHRQGVHFGDPNLVCSFVVGDWPKHQRLELENDLIANHVEAHGAPPAAQFLG